MSTLEKLGYLVAANGYKVPYKTDSESTPRWVRDDKKLVEAIDAMRRNKKTYSCKATKSGEMICRSKISEEDFEDILQDLRKQGFN